MTVDLGRVREVMVDIEDHHEEEITVIGVISRLLDYDGDEDTLDVAIRSEVERAAILLDRVYHRRLGMPLRQSTAMAIGFLQGITFAAAYRQVAEGE